MKKLYIKRSFVFILIIMILFTNFYRSKALAGSTAPWPKCPSIKAKNAVVMDLATGTVLVSKNATKKWYPASTTKVMTAMLAIEKAKSLDEMVEFTKEAINVSEPGSSSIGMTPGEKLPLRECLYGLMLASANEVANAIAIHTAGSIEDFADMMNEKAEALGCVNTHFTNPSGLYEKDHYTCPEDLAKIAREAIKLDDFREIAGTRTHVIPETNLMKEKRPVSNTNQLFNPVKLPQHGYEYCYAGKTGYTNEARFNLVSFSKKGAMDVVCVIMNAESADVQYTNTKKLVDYAFKRFRMLQTDKIPLKLNESGGKTYISILENDPSAEFTVSGTAALVVPKKCDINGVVTEIKENNLTAIKVGKNYIGSVEYKYGGECIGSADIVYTSSKAYSFEKSEMISESLPEENKEKRLNYFAVGMIVVSVLVILGLVWYLLIYRRPSNMARRRYRRKKRRINSRNRLKW
ncbi:MAG: D-alanyl-D-alanine carboxypeptidase family protein [Catonella sp.]|uniref:D-alanyl-D-alanine carboxypeptidase family protein n=1 Tax=Catonella sp. TaxID=2382125 RepID=UPI003F9F1670